MTAVLTLSRADAFGAVGNDGLTEAQRQEYANQFWATAGRPLDASEITAYERLRAARAIG